MSATDTGSPPSRWRTVALVISLAFNVLLLAIILVGLMRAANRAFIAQPGGVLAPAAVMRDLEGERKEAIHAVQLKHRAAQHGRSMEEEARKDHAS